MSEVVQTAEGVALNLAMGTLMKFLNNNKIEIVEVPYVCKPRLSGYSKTSTNYFSLLKLSVPYIRAALIK